MVRKTVKTWIYTLAKDDGFFWIRFRGTGFGIIGKDTTKNGLIFSERMGYRKRIRYKNWLFGFLKPIRQFKVKK